MHFLLNPWTTLKTLGKRNFQVQKLNNNKFKEEAADILFSEDNPFGEVN